MRDFIDGIERELRSSCPLKSKTDLGKFRSRLNAKRLRGGRKRFERELEELLQSDRFLRQATERHLARVVPAAIEAALVLLEQGKAVLAKAKETRRKKPREFLM